ncbi:MAG: dephospho-CoA kinase [Alphaproteobacteria bacterium]|nr:dephospho-CoA kinase [Alphaproteobacteria bacterium]
MLVIGLTGSIGMGKSTAAGMLRRLGVPVHDSDAAVHRLIGRGGRAVRRIGDAFPGVVKEGAVDRAALGARVFGDPAALKRLEAILHPMVAAEKGRFLRRWASRRRWSVALDVPLLYETKGDRHCDATILVSAPAFIQANRVLRRPGMTRARLDEIRARQMPEAEKKRRATYIVPTGLGYRLTFHRLAEIVATFSCRHGKHWPPR